MNTKLKSLMYFCHGVYCNLKGTCLRYLAKDSTEASGEMIDHCDPETRNMFCTCDKGNDKD